MWFIWYEYNTFITKVTLLLNTLSDKINSTAFDTVRANLGIKRLEDLNVLASLSKKEIIYSKFPKPSTKWELKVKKILIKILIFSLQNDIL